MGLATRLGPWLIGTVKNTIASLTQTNASNGLIANLGPCISVQTRVINFNETTAQTPAFVVPAGSILLSASALVTTTFAGASPSLILFSGGTQIGTATTLNAAVPGFVSLPIGNDSAASATRCNNVGTTDQLIAFSLTAAGQSAGICTLIVQYVVRNPDGTYAYPFNQA